ncbi:MAG: EAL domain-containing protein [Flavobacteriales bacterium]|nr:EAL domain-containing protein [Flavobacteriales bacterium]
MNLSISAAAMDVILDLTFAVPITIILVYFVREYLKAENNKAKTEEQYQSVVNSIKEIVFQTDSNGVWTFLNPAWTEVTGFDVKESIGSNFINYVYPEDREGNMALFLPLMERKKDYCRYETRYVKKDGGYCWIEVFARLILDDKGNSIGTTGTLMDITKRKLIEEELLNRDRLLHGISESRAILLKTVDLDKALNMVLEVLGKAALTDRVYIFQNYLNPKTKKLEASQRYEWCNIVIEQQNISFNLQNICYDEMGIMRWFNTLSGGSEISGNVCDLPIAEREVLEPLGIKTLAVVPIFVESNFWGFLCFDASSHNRSWSNSEIKLLSTVAASIGGAIKRVQDEENIQTLLKSDLKQTVQNLQNLVFKCKRSQEGDIYFTLFEGKLAEKIGLSTDIVYQKKLTEVLKAKSNASILENFNRAFEGHVCYFEMQSGDITYYTSLSPIFNEKEVVEIVGSSIDITSLKVAEKKIRQLAYHDMLSGLPNRRFFKEHLNYMLSHANRNRKKLAVMFLDLDRFKLINDTLGHAVGDELLRKVANRIKQTINEDEIVARMGGDEFIIAFPEVIDRNIARMAQDIINAFREPFNLEDRELFITTSIGISLYPEDGQDIDSLIKNADSAMYRAKENGRNNYQYYTEDMNISAIKRLDIENYLRKAIDRKELFVVYQPRIEIKTGRLVGAEALLRWRHPLIGLIPPAEFIPIAEETGLISCIGNWVLKTVCNQVKKWHDNGYTGLKYSVNISAIQFQRANFLENIKRIINESGIEPTMLELEITENTVMHFNENTLAIIRELKGMGIEISIDDFGTGFSSLSYIKAFDSDSLKIDKSFIWDIGLSASNESIITAIINMAHSMQMQVIAEGVETNEQLDFLRNRSCDEVQGYLFSKPMETIAFNDFLNNSIGEGKIHNL